MIRDIFPIDRNAPDGREVFPNKVVKPNGRKLSEDVILEMVERYRGGESLRVLGKAYGVCHSLVIRYVNGSYGRGLVSDDGYRNSRGRKKASEEADFKG